MDIQTHRLMMGAAGVSLDTPQDHFFVHFDHGSSYEALTPVTYRHDSQYGTSVPLMGNVVFDHDNNVYVLYGVQYDSSPNSWKGEWAHCLVKLNAAGTFQWIKRIEKSGFPGNDVDYVSDDWKFESLKEGHIFARTNTAGDATVIYTMHNYHHKNNDYGYLINTDDGQMYGHNNAAWMYGWDTDGSAGWCLDPSAGSGGSSTLSGAIGSRLDSGASPMRHIHLWNTNANDMTAILSTERSSTSDHYMWVMDDETNGANRLLDYRNAWKVDSDYRYYYNNAWDGTSSSTYLGSAVAKNSNTTTSSIKARTNNFDDLGVGTVSGSVKGNIIWQDRPYSSTDGRRYQDKTSSFCSGESDTQHAYKPQIGAFKINHAKSDYYDNTYVLLNKHEGSYESNNPGGMIRYDSVNVNTQFEEFEWVKWTGGSPNFSILPHDIAFDSSNNVYGMFLQTKHAGDSDQNNYPASVIIVKWNDGTKDVDWIRRIQIWKSGSQYGVRPANITVDNNNRILVYGDHSVDSSNHDDFEHPKTWLLKVKWDGSGTGTYGSSGSWQCKYENPSDVGTTTINTPLARLNGTTNAYSSARDREEWSQSAASPRSIYGSTGTQTHGDGGVLSVSTTTTDLGNY